MQLNFRQFVEDKTHSLEKGHENLLDGMWRELGIKPADLPDMIESGPIEIDGLYYNQAVWQLKKPVQTTDNFVSIKLVNLNSPNLNQRVYVKQGDKMVPYAGNLDYRWHLITLDKLAKMLGRPWQSAQPQGLM